MSRKYGARVDANQETVTAALRKAGASVQSLRSVGQGCPDIIVGFRGVNYLLEVKDGSKEPARRRLSDDEQAWHLAWKGAVIVVENPEQALAAIATIERALIG